MSSEKTYVIRLMNGEIVFGLSDGNPDELGLVRLKYPISINIVPQQDEHGNVQQGMSINPYFPFGEYKNSEGIEFNLSDTVHFMPAVDGIQQVHQNYMTQMRAQETGLVVAGANDLPENQNAVDLSDMTQDGLRISE